MSHDDNDQNTFSGGGGAVTAPLGNSFLDGLAKLAAVAVTGVTVYEDSQDRKAAREINIANAINPPQQTLPARLANSPADYLSNPAAVQAMAYYGIGFIVIGSLSLWALKKL